MKYIVVAGLMMINVLVLHAQDYPIPPKRTTAAKVGFFGGVTPSWIFVDVAPINAYLVPAGGALAGSRVEPVTGGRNERHDTAA